MKSGLAVIKGQTYGSIPMGTPLMGASNGSGMKKSLFSTNILLYLCNNTT